MKPIQLQNDIKARDEKIKLMNDRQKQWMEERKNTRPKNFEALDQSKLAGDISHQRSKPKKQNYTREKMNSSEVFLWTAKTQEAVNDGFVVRKPPGKPDDRKSSRSSTSKAMNRPRSGRSTSRYERGQGLKGSGKPDEMQSHLTSTPVRPISNSSVDLGISEKLSSISISKSVNKERVRDGAENVNNYDKYQYSSVSDHELESKSSDSGFNATGNYGFADLNGDQWRTNNTFTMHCCPHCKILMNLQSHRPFLIIPCGHNLCAQCQPTQSECPTCKTQILSSVENSALSHVIIEYKKQEERKELARKEQEAKKFIEEYDSLKTRCDVLSCKAEVVIETLENITGSLVHMKNNMKANEEKKAEIHHKISCLEKELSIHENEYGSYEKQCNELELSYSKEKENLDMIENTLERVKQSKERVKQLILGYIPSFRFEED